VKFDQTDAPTFYSGSLERNPLRAGLVERAEHWSWSSLSHPPATPHAWLDPGPAPRGKGWVEEVNRIAANDDEVIHLQKCIERGAPFGSESWSSFPGGRRRRR
jgi:putative transposase